MGRPMTIEEQLERDIIDYGDTSSNPGKPLNKYIVDRAKRELLELQKKKVKVIEKEVEKIVKLTFNEYKKMTVSKLKVIAKKLGIPKYYDLKEDRLINEIMKRH